MNPNWSILDYLATLPHDEQEEAAYRLDERIGMMMDSLLPEHQCTEAEAVAMAMGQQQQEIQQ